MPQSQPLDELSVPQHSLVSLRPKQLDAALGPVIVPQQISLVHGPDRAPLTLIAHAVVAGGLPDGGRSVFLDSGGNYSPNLMRSLLSRDPSDTIGRIIVGPVFGLSDLSDAIENVFKMDNVRVIVLDSLTAVLNMTGDVGSKNRQRNLFRVLELLRGLVIEKDIHVLMTDYSQKDWKTGELKIIGGNVLTHGIDTSVYCSAIRDIDDGILVTVERSPVFPLPNPVAVKIGPKGSRPLGTR